MTSVFSGSVLVKCGVNVSDVFSASATNGYMTDFIQQAEDTINAETRKVWDATNKSYTLAVSNLAAIYAISYDMSGYTSRLEAQTIIDILYDGYRKAIKFLEDQKTKDFINAP